MDGIGTTLALPGLPPPAAGGGGAMAPPAADFRAILPAVPPWPTDLTAGITDVPGTARRGKDPPAGGNDLPPPPPWLPLPRLMPLPAAVPAGVAPAGEGEARPPAPAPARPGRGPAVPAGLSDPALPGQVLAHLAAKSGAPGQAPDPGPPAPPVPDGGSASTPVAPPRVAPPADSLDPLPALPGRAGEPAARNDAQPAPPGRAPPHPSPAAPALAATVPPAGVRPPGAAAAGVEPAVSSPVQIEPDKGPEEPSPPETRANPPQPLPALPTAPAAREPAAPAMLQLATPVGGEGFAQSLGERVTWMIDRDLGGARLRLNPPQLGPVEVRVQVNGDQASVSFTAHNLAARDALEQAMPRLREMLGAQGFAHVDVNVAQHSFSERPTRSAPWEPLPPPSVPAAEAAAALPAPSATRVLAALLDAYA